MPQSAHASVAVCKRMYKLKLIMKHAAFYQHMNISGLCPIKQLLYKSGDILRQGSEVYHIAKGSISRKKMRLKEKMHIEDTTLDDFIRQF